MSNDKTIPFNLNEHTYRLLESEPFFAALSRRINKSKSSAVPTAGVRINPRTGRFEMVYNPEFFEGLTPKERRGVLKHEFYHLVFLHVSTRKPDGTNDKVWNFATDLAINSHLDNLPKNCLKPGEGLFKDYESGLSAEAYLELLKNDPDFNPDEQGNGQGDGSGSGEQFDSHEGWGDADSTSNEIAKERLKEDIKKAASEIPDIPGSFAKFANQPNDFPPFQVIDCKGGRCRVRQQAWGRYVHWEVEHNRLKSA